MGSGDGALSCGGGLHGWFPKRLDDWFARGSGAVGVRRHSGTLRPLRNVRFGVGGDLELCGDDVSERVKTGERRGVELHRR